ncbi:MAG: hypothetical protein ACR2OM_06235 [Aestuariivirgaceae bacterium]
MLAKVLMATLTAALAFMVARQLKQRSDKAKAHLNTKREQSRDRVVTLREDPDTGVFRPADKD